MALIACKECSKDVSTEAKACPNCGARIKPKSKAVRNTLLAVVGLTVAFLGFGAIVSNSPEGQARAKDRAGYEECLRVKRQNPDNQFASDACEYMKSEFVKKHGRNP